MTVLDHDLAPSTATEVSNTSPDRRTRAKRRKRRPLVVVSAVIVMVLFGAASVSYVQKLRQPGSDTTVERSVEWLRDNHLGAVVNWFESASYSLHPPQEGGAPPPITTPTTDAAPTPQVSSTVPGHEVAHLPTPATLASPAPNPVPGEGQWTPVGPRPGNVAGMYMTQVRPDSVHTSYLDLVVWMDPKVVRFEQHPGVEVPGGSFPTPSSVPNTELGQLVGVFNGGFRMQDARGGYYQDGQGASTLADGAATLAIMNDGTATVGQWGRDLRLTGSIVSARQNLALIVDGGAPVSGLDENPGDRWGATVGNKVFVWRSGVGVTADGALVYVGGPALSAKTLAETLARAGAVRAMELDINQDWVTFNSYQTANGQASGTKLLDGMSRPGNRYLTTDSRDFVAVLLRP